MSNGSLSIVTFNRICDKCSQIYQREIRIDDDLVLNDSHLTDQEKAEKCVSNTEKVFCSSCTTNFIKWMKEKGYLRTDCWCSHIEEWKKEVT